MDILQRILHDLRDKQASVDSTQLPTARTKREPSATERNQPYLPVNYGLLFCCHGKSYFDTCASCKRSRKDAKRQYEYFCLKNGVIRLSVHTVIACVFMYFVLLPLCICTSI